MAAGSKVRRGRSRRKGRTVVALAVIAVVGWLVYTTVNILAPAQGERTAPVDALISLAPQQHRLPLAQELIAAGASDTLLISYFDHDPMNDLPPAGQQDDVKSLAEQCDADADSRIMCFTPEEDATIGEVHAIEAIAHEHSWGRITVVTDSFHAFRTRYLFNQCMPDDIEVNVVFAKLDMGPAQRAWRAVYENAAFVKALWQTTTRC